VSRHRSPEGRGAHQPLPLLAQAHATDGGRGAHHRSVPAPVRRGVTAMAVAGGTFALVGAGVPLMAQAAHDANTAQQAPLPPAPVRTVAAAAVLPAPAAVATVQPVSMTPQGATTSGAALVKAVQLVEQQVARTEADKATADKATADKAKQEAGQKAGQKAAANPSCGLDESGLGRVKPHVRRAAEILGCMYGEPTIYGVAGRGGTSDHPGGLALDFMVDTATGNDLAQCVLRNQDVLGVKYVIWRQRINTGSGWKPMEDRGGATANHFDHVHVSFDRGAGSGGLEGC
jgi:hypothetical protein